MYISGDYLKKDVEKGLNTLLRLSELNDCSSLIKLGVNFFLNKKKLYYYGDNVEKSEKKSKEYFIKALESKYQLITIQNWSEVYLLLGNIYNY
jgi:hypothetical protein